VGISLFPLDKSGFPTAVNNRFRNHRVRHKSSRNEVGMKKTTLLSILVVAVQLAVAVVAEAQPLKKIPRIGYLAADSQAPSRDSFRQGLRDLGYVEGQSIVIEWRHAEGKSEQFAEYVSELVLARRIR
jgi:hypothetical protein